MLSPSQLRSAPDGHACLAGPAASTVAATVPFAIGTETEGSLMSPADTCGVSAMRPSLGSIGRSYVMTLADSLVRGD